jgi:DNA topoisomerase-1
MKSLIIVESFTKTKTIKKYLGDRDVVVTFSAGHIYNLPKDTLGFDTDTWDIHYVPTNPSIIKNIKELARSADIIYLAADPDLEGEAIAHSLFKCLQGIINDGGSGSSGGGKVCHRITFNEITKNAVLNAIDNPRTISMDKVNAQETRRIVDRLIGYKVSPVLWNKFNKNYLSAGRVQIAGLILCINQRNRIINKEIIPYWTIDCVFGIGNGKDANAITVVGTLDHKIRDVKTVKEVLNNATISTKYKISYETRIRNVSPQPPYTTTTLQQDAYNKCRFNAKATMKLAQDLYEHGYITYMRTDSTSIAEDAKKMILSYIKETFDTPMSAYTYSKYRSYKTKVANAQEAHEAVRITNPKHKSLTFEGATKNHEKLYALIWKRTLASLMSDAVYHDICLKLEGTSGNTMDTYYATKPFLKELGFQIVYKEVEEADVADVADAADADIEGFEGFVDILKKSNMTAVSKEYSSQGTIDDIPSLYNEVQLIKELEKEGIGRPSTYASIIDKLLEKKYVEIGTNPQQEYEIECFKKKKSGIVQSMKKINLGGKQKDLLVPTELGIEVIKYIFELFPYLCDLQFTSKMEDELDKIINASITKEDILNDLYAKIKTSIASIANVPDTQGGGSCGSGSRNGNIGNKEKKTGILTTRYGVCYYNKDTDKYTNIEPYLKWKQITKEQLTERDIKFISSLPKPIEYVGKKYNLHLGKYGIYLKDNKNNNHKLDKKLWNDYY